MALRIWVTVKPQAKRQEIRKVADGEYSATVHSPPHEGQANRALTKLLADHFSVPKSSIKIILGQASKKKLVEIG